MSTARRSFFALIGNAVVSGLVAHQAAAKAPTLILPPKGIIPPQPTTAGLYPLLSQQPTQMHAFISVKGGVPDEIFLDWLESGLRLVEGCQSGGLIWQAMQMEREGRG